MSLWRRSLATRLSAAASLMLGGSSCFRRQRAASFRARSSAMVGQRSPRHCRRRRPSRRTIPRIPNTARFCDVIAGPIIAQTWPNSPPGAASLSLLVPASSREPPQPNGILPPRTPVGAYVSTSPKCLLFATARYRPVHRSRRDTQGRRKALTRSCDRRILETDTKNRWLRLR
jgi:hypothetical protein